MPAVSPSSLPSDWSFAEFWTHLGDIPPARIRMSPPPGTATEEDVLEYERRVGMPCELIDGTLVEKTMGYFESFLAVRIIQSLAAFVDAHDLGIVLGEAGTLKIQPRQVRVPDVCFLSWDRFPDRKLPRESIPALTPDLAIEVLSEGNTPAEMRRKLQDYFASGVRLVWYIDPRTRSARSYTAEDSCVELGETASLSGGDVLPGFELSLKELFSEVGG